MKADLQRANLRLPVPAGAEARLYQFSKPAHTHAGYTVSDVIDTVEIGRSNFQALPANRQANHLSTPQTGKGVYIDLWT